MRTFIAIPLPDACRMMLARMQQNLQRYRAEVRWVAIPSIHLTLKFLGEADTAIIPQLAEALESLSNTQRRFELKLQGLGCFPNPRNPRVIWCGVAGEIERLSALQQKVEIACGALGFAPEDREFHPHLTLGRVNGKRNLQPILDYIKIGSDLECSFQANHFNIYRSILKPQGAEYSVLKSIALDE
jgi:RNA 2',3'-cyclic 3'-phosphodiesterase